MFIYDPQLEYFLFRFVSDNFFFFCVNFCFLFELQTYRSELVFKQSAN